MFYSWGRGHNQAPTAYRSLVIKRAREGTDQTSNMVGLGRIVAKAVKENSDTELMIFFVTSGTPWAVADSPFFLSWLQSLRPSYTPPSTHENASDIILQRPALTCSDSHQRATSG